MGFIVAYTMAFIGLWMALLTPVALTLALKIRQVDPESASGSLALVLGSGALVALVANPFFGRLSDRTTSGFGMRRPWILGGLLFGTGGLAALALAPGLPLILIAWCFTQISFNALIPAITALLPDQVPVEQRGLVSGLSGIGFPVGLVGGAFLAQLVSGSIFLMFMVPAAVCVVSIVVLVTVLDDRRQAPGYSPPPYTPREFFNSFWINPVRYPDFGWAWLSRFLLNMGAATLVTYQVFYLIEHLGMSEDRIPRLVLITTLVLDIGLAVFSVAGGALSDLAGGRRKVFVFGSAVIFGTGAAFIAFAGSFGDFLVGVAVCGVGFGVYLAVDLALISQVLPSTEDASKDLGVFGIAASLPQSLAPVIAPVFLNITLSGGEGSNYTALFFVAALYSIGGAIAILPVKGVR